MPESSKHYIKTARHHILAPFAVACVGQNSISKTVLEILYTMKITTF
jgi:hypothetical protein